MQRQSSRKRPRGKVRYEPEMSEKPLPADPNQIQIDLDEATAQGAYANLVLINHSDNEFVFDFAFLQPNAPRARVRSRIVSSPKHTKRMLRALEFNVRRYEERFGLIDEGEGPSLPPSPRVVS